MGTQRELQSISHKVFIAFLVGLFLINAIAFASTGALSPIRGNPEVYQEMRSVMGDRLKTSHTTPPVLRRDLRQKNSTLILLVNLSDIGAEIRDGQVVISGRGLLNVEKLIPSFVDSRVRTVYLDGGLYEMSDLSKKVHVNPAHNLERRFITSGKAVILVENYATFHENVCGVELNDSFGNPFSIYGMDRFNSRLAPEGADVRKCVKATIDKVHDAGIDVMVDFIPWLSPDSVNEKNYKWMNYRELDGDDDKYFRSLQHENEKMVWIENLLARPENYGYFAVLITEAGSERVILVQHVLSLGVNADQARPNPLNPDVQRYYIESIKALVDLGVDKVRVDLAHYLLVPGLGDEDQLIKKIIDIAKEYARSQGREIGFVMEAYDDVDRERLEHLGADMVYSKRIFESFWSIARDGARADTIKDAVWHALYATPRPLIFASNFDQTSLAAIGGGGKGLSMLLTAIGHLRKTPVMFDLRDWLLHKGDVIKIPGGGISSDSDSQHIFATKEELLIRTDFANMKSAVKNAPVGKVVQDFHAAVKTHEERWIESPPTTRADALFPLCWKTENGGWVMLVVNLKPSGEIVHSYVGIPDQAQKEFSHSGVTVQDAFEPRAYIRVEHGSRFEVEFNSGEEYRIFNINPREFSDECDRVQSSIMTNEELVRILLSFNEKDMHRYVVRYNEQALQDYETRAHVDAGTMERVLNAYVCLLEKRMGRKDAVELRKAVSTKCKNQPLISVEHYRGISDDLVGRGCVDVKGGVLDEGAVLKMTEILNIAVAVSNISCTEGEMDSRARDLLIPFIQQQYGVLTGGSITREAILNSDRTIILPQTKSVSREMLPDYYESTIRQIMKYA